MSATLAEAQIPELRVGILVDEITSEMKPIVGQLQNEIVSVIGNDANISFPPESILMNNFNSELAEQHYRTLLNSNIDIILAFGPVNNEVISKQTMHAKPTILFGSVNQDLLDVDASAGVSGIDNFTFLISSQSYEKDLKDFSTLFKFQNIGVVSTNPETLESYALRERLDEIFRELGATYRLIRYTSLEQLEKDLGEIDSVYIAEGFSISRQEIRDIAALLQRKRLPSFTSTRQEDVELGIMATNQAKENLDLLFRRIALTVEAAVNGENLAEQPIYVDFGESMAVNFNTSERVGVSMKYSQIASIDFVGNVDNIFADETYSIQEAIKVILKENLSLQSSQKDIELAELDVRSARTNYHPNLSVSATSNYVDPDLANISGGQAPEKSTNASLSLSQTLYSQSANANIGIQKSLLDAQQEDFNSTELDLIQDAANAGIDLLSLKTLMKIEQENLDVTRRNLKVAQQNFEAGQASKSDIFRFQSEIASNMQSFIEAIASYGQGMHRLNSFFNNPIETRIDILDIPLESSPFEGFGYSDLADMLDDPRQSIILENFLVTEAFANSPELKSLLYNIDATEIDKAQWGWRRFLPTISAQASYNELIDQGGAGTPSDEAFIEDDYSVGVTFSVPLYSQNTERVARRAAETQLQKLRISQAQTAQTIEVNVRDAILEVTSRISGNTLSKVAEDAARQSLALTESSYSNGAATIADLIDAQNNYFQAQSASANAKYDFIKAAIELERQVGYFYFLLPSSVEGVAFMQRLTEFRNGYQADQ